MTLKLTIAASIIAAVGFRLILGYKELHAEIVKLKWESQNSYTLKSNGTGAATSTPEGRRFATLERLTWAGHEALDQKRNGQHGRG